MSNTIKLADRLMAYLQGRLPAAERDKLEQEMAQDEKLAQLVAQLRDRTYVSHELDHLRRFDVDRGLHRLKAVMDSRRQSPARDPRRRRLRWIPWLSGAAAVLLVVSASVFWYRSRIRTSPLQIPQEVSQAMAKSQAKGHTGAVITDMMSKEAPASVVAKMEQSGMDEDVKQELLHATRVQTYVNKEYWVTLPDGSLVHLAPGTHLIYPERFRESTRDVYLEGEAYFMVAHSKGNRFIVHTAHGDVMEYGTEFDVDTRDPSGTSVVLVEGSISVKPTVGREQMVTPGERAEFGTDSVLISHTDIAPYRAWNTGKVEFSNWPLERLMTVMAKWYNVNIEYADDEMRAIRVSGNFDRYEDLQPTMEALGTITGLHLKINGRRISITK